MQQRKGLNYSSQMPDADLADGSQSPAEGGRALGWDPVSTKGRAHKPISVPWRNTAARDDQVSDM